MDPGPISVATVSVRVARCMPRLWPRQGAVTIPSCWDGRSLPAMAGSQSDRGVQAVIRACYSAGEDLGVVRRRLLLALHRVVPFDAAFFAGADPDTMLFTSAYADEALRTSAAEFLDNEFGPAPTSTASSTWPGPAIRSRRWTTPRAVSERPAPVGGRSWARSGWATRLGSPCGSPARRGVSCACTARGPSASAQARWRSCERSPRHAGEAMRRVTVGRDPRLRRGPRGVRGGDPRCRSRGTGRRRRGGGVRRRPSHRRRALPVPARRGRAPTRSHRAGRRPVSTGGPPQSA